MLNRSWLNVARVDVAGPPPQVRRDTSTSGAPAWVTNVGRIRSTGLPDALAMAFQKSSDVALAYACACRYALMPERKASAPTYCSIIRRTAAPFSYEIGSKAASISVGVLTAV